MPFEMAICSTWYVCRHGCTCSIYECSVCSCSRGCTQAHLLLCCLSEVYVPRRVPDELVYVVLLSISHVHASKECGLQERRNVDRESAVHRTSRRNAWRRGYKMARKGDLEKFATCVVPGEMVPLGEMLLYPEKMACFQRRWFHDVQPKCCDAVMDGAFYPRPRQAHVFDSDSVSRIPGRDGMVRVRTQQPRRRSSTAPSHENKYDDGAKVLITQTVGAQNENENDNGKVTKWCVQNAP